VDPLMTTGAEREVSQLVRDERQWPSFRRRPACFIA